ncbi:cytochrome ubiquinol oxidase subunit I [Desulfobacterales bacterium HSG16]|nr:cytochrome ubiquinol oxidase subunit I [Desulfobacterales bacterium HSG16]
MNYPVWELYSTGGGLLMVIIAVVHVYVAHFAVGGGLFLVLTEMKGYRENSSDILDFTKKHSRFFMLLSVVFGSVTGVGIWFIISLISPDATSTLTHHFVFIWAAEWVCFGCEIIAIFVYYYRFGKMNRKAHLKIGWLYFLFAWLSLFFVNGIIAFMLTPGEWPETGNMWDGFFNPTMLPSLFFRTALSLVLAGIFGFVTAVFIKKTEFRETMIRYCAKWLILPFVFMMIFAFWYFKALPDAPRAMVMGRSPELIPVVKIFMWFLPLLFIGSLAMAIRMPGSVKKPAAFVILAIGLVYMGAFEWIREASRRPYLIYGHTWSNSIRVWEEEYLNKNGLLQTAKWIKNREIKDDNMLEAGREIFKIECISCHSVGGPLNDILPLTSRYSILGMDSQLNGQGKINDYMPQFMGTSEERMTLARFIVQGLHGKKDTKASADMQNLPVKIPMENPVKIPEFDEEKSEYVLLAWSDSGMYTIPDSKQFHGMGPEGNNLFAQLIRRGETPEIVTEDVELTYKDSGQKKLQNLQITYDKTLNGTMELNQDLMAFAAESIPVRPYKDDGSFNPYPVFTIEARSKTDGKILGKTRVVAPVSTEMGCNNCHGGKWRAKGSGGISDQTSNDILTVHDRISRTNLLDMAQKGRSIDCSSCHSDSISGAEGQSERLNLSASIHGFHANYLTEKDGDACHLCHPSSPDGNTRFFRGIHKSLDMDCINCHGKMEDLALSLLVAEKQAGKKSADRLMKYLSPQAVQNIDQVSPRKPWINEPDCLNCHVDFQPPETDESEINMWTKNREQLFHMRTGEAGIMCQACHGSSHAVYPTANFLDKDRDNIQPMQYQKNQYPIGANKNCKVCHTIDMEEEIHHPNMLNMFRNSEL